MTLATVDPLFVSQGAIDKLLQLIEEEENPQLMLRVYVTGGGCAGFQYGFDFDEQQAEDDTLISHGQARVLVDSMSIQYLAASTIDFIEDLGGSRFVVQNPSATSTCGCGASFSI